MRAKQKLSVLNIEQHVKADQANYGRAVVLYPRSMEMLDQLGLFDEIREIGFITKGSATFKNGQKVESRGWSFIDEAIRGSSNFEYCLGIRQPFTEECFRNRIGEIDANALTAPAKLIDFSVNNVSEYPVTAQIDINGEIIDIQAKYLVGADGGQSTVRRLANIAFPGKQSPFKWIRLDATVRTNMPAPREAAVSIESPTYGNVLWIPVDNGRNRIGIVWTDHDNEPTEETIIQEVKKAIQPFDVDFVTLDWWTKYDIGQRVAERFKYGPIILAGDAAHAHSSASAQGMNTGIHDSTNLGWKLAGVLKGWYSERVLDTYEDERKSSAQKVIQIDTDVASCVSGTIPAHLNAPPDADPNEYLIKLYKANASFNVGLGVSYGENLINRSNPKAPTLAIQVGHRPADPPLFQPGAKFPKRMQEFMPNNGKFWIAVFAGGLDPDSKVLKLRETSVERFAVLKEYLEGPSSFVNTLSPVFQFLTIIRGDGIFQSAETLDSTGIGKVVHDRTGEAYEAYGVDDIEGAIVVLRPDGVVGFFAGMDQEEDIAKYFEEFVLPRSTDGPLNGVRQKLGVVLVDDSAKGKGTQTKI
ncbi:hypothetical protein M422DRAFT_34345 [Sphaerobolus stellatus SS14]|uniref:FAD-binding domain-containing protein n=1 Tax=Sphaerobolus stellatus (strain SS14) TaxID=990650 RepID=A0A0C9U0X1_SPHS4|nr:hypothetical protein M422DRAFT_34345 [Sphaerobolus stellatus SS14]